VETTTLRATERAGWDRDGFFVIKRFVDPDTLPALTARIEEIADDHDAGRDIGRAMPVPEGALAHAPTPAGRLSKVFKLHRDEPLFNELAVHPELLGRVAELLGDDLDCFLSQFIFKHPGALGQPWHQDAFYFRMTPPVQVGAWLAVTEAHLENGPLWVVPGSHHEPIHESVAKDEREHANMFYVEIQGVDTAEEVPVLLDPGDLLVFHSHLRHRSTDNNSADDRAAMVFHYATPGTTGIIAPNHDWMPVLRSAAPVTI
jgi:ectoine hydroxylase-related dioxygenase (phytanoyl-CoA dioxygenase family)